VHQVHVRLLVPEVYTRKLAHMGAGVVFILLPLWLSRNEIIVIAIVLSAMLVATKYSRRFASIHTTTRRTWGEIYYPLSLALTAYFLLPLFVPAFQYGVMVLGIGDGLAEIVGRAWGAAPDSCVLPHQDSRGELSALSCFSCRIFHLCWFCARTSSGGACGSTRHHVARTIPLPRPRQYRASPRRCRFVCVADLINA